MFCAEAKTSWDYYQLYFINFIIIMDFDEINHVLGQALSV